MPIDTSTDAAVDATLHQVCRTIRNCKSHFHLAYEDLSTDQYFAACDTPKPAWLPATAAAYYRLCLFDIDFEDDQRCLKINYSELRYYLHQFLDAVLADVRWDVLGNPMY